MISSKSASGYDCSNSPVVESKTTGFLRLPQVLELVPVGKSTIYYLMAKGEFPKQVKLGYKLAVWRKSDIENYMNKFNGGSDE